MCANQIGKSFSMLRALCVVTCAAVGTALCTLAIADGGCDYGGPNNFVTGGNFDGLCTDVVEKYVIGGNVWTRAASMINKRCGHVMVRTGEGDSIYVIGGYNNTGVNNAAVALSAVEAYDEYNNVWKSVAPLPKSLTSFAAVPWDGYIFVFGGTSVPKSAKDASRAIYIYDTKNNKWITSATTLPAPLWYERAVVADNGAGDPRIYIIGGKDSQGNDLDTVLRFKPNDDKTGGTWEDFPNKLKVPRSGFAAATLGDKSIYVAGGQNGNAALDSIEKYDPSGQGGWQTLDASLIFKTADVQGTVTQIGSLLIPAGKHSLSKDTSDKDVQEIHLVPTGELHTVTLYMHGPENSHDYGGLIMNQIVPKTASAPLQLGILSSQSWESMPSFTGTFTLDPMKKPNVTTVTATIPCSLGLGLGSSISLSARSVNGGDGSSRQLGSTSIPIGACLGALSVDVNIPISVGSTSVQLENEELELELSTILGALLTLTPDAPMKLTITNYQGMPGPSAKVVVKSDASLQ
ncbi:kelch-like protein [Burkholderia sp. Bp9126]|nr:kelch-like protein [Burkholderia sp. Bp9126]